jgi:hypothetical protein
MGERDYVLRAADLAAMLRTAIFDLEDAAELLGIRTGSLTQAMYRRRIAYVRYRGHVYFALEDLRDYANARGPGLLSEIGPARVLEVVGEGRTREVRKLVPRLF